MTLFFAKTTALQLKRGAILGGILLFSAQVQADPGAEGPFTGMSGHWSGGGTITMTNGSSERIRCRGTYSVNANGRMVQQDLRCASDSYRLEISSSVTSEGGALSGFWSEATRGVSGNVSGRASAAGIIANVMGPNFGARLDVRTHGDRQSVTIRPQGDTDVTAVSIALRKG